MTKEELIKSILERSPDLHSKAAAERTLNATLDAIRAGLKKDGHVQIVNFGSWSVKKTKKRQGRNPQTGEVITIKAKKVVRFSAGKGLKVQKNLKVKK